MQEIIYNDEEQEGLYFSYMIISFEGKADLIYFSPYSFFETELHQAKGKDDKYPLCIF